MPRIQNDLAQLTYRAIRKAQKKGDLPKFNVPDITIDRPKTAEHGDYSTAVCMAMARFAKRAPVEIAKLVVKRFPNAEFVGDVRKERCET